MASEGIGDMTLAELEAVVYKLVDARLRYWPGEQPQDNRLSEQIFQSLRKNMLKKRPGQPSVLDMLREDRDR